MMPLLPAGISSNSACDGCAGEFLFAVGGARKSGTCNRGFEPYKYRLALRACRKSRRVKPDVAFLSPRGKREARGSITAAGCLCRGFAIALPQGQAADHYTRLPPVLFPSHASV